jgi:hypothetical protein
LAKKRCQLDFDYRILMMAFFKMNGADYYADSTRFASKFPISEHLFPF